MFPAQHVIVACDGIETDLLLVVCHLRQPRHIEHAETVHSGIAVEQIVEHHGRLAPEGQQLLRRTHIGSEVEIARPRT